MTTRWFVEVSPVDADTLKERYCVEALQWQQALQQARKLRGDRGALSRFAIELLEAGYRATDPSSRSQVHGEHGPREIPPLSGAAAARTPAQAPAVSGARRQRRAAPRLRGRSRSPRPSSPLASRHPCRRSRRRGALVAGAGCRCGAGPAVAAPVAAAASVPRHRLRPQVTGPGRSARPEPVPNRSRSRFRRRAPEPRAEPVPVASRPGSHFRSAKKSRREASPITYREFAFSVAPGLDPKVSSGMREPAWEQVRTGIAHRAAGKFVQIALFDHRFAGRPERPPVAVLAWKDWRGDPVVQVRASAGRGPAATPNGPRTQLRSRARASSDGPSGCAGTAPASVTPRPRYKPAAARGVRSVHPRHRHRGSSPLHRTRRAGCARARRGLPSPAKFRQSRRVESCAARSRRQRPAHPEVAPRRRGPAEDSHRRTLRRDAPAPLHAGHRHRRGVRAERSDSRDAERRRSHSRLRHQHAAVRRRAGARPVEQERAPPKNPRHVPALPRSLSTGARAPFPGHRVGRRLRRGAMGDSRG